MDELVKIEKKKFNKLNKKFNNLLKNLGKLDNNKLDITIIKRLNLLNSNIDVLINLVNECNLDILKKKKNISKKLNKKISIDEDINKIINLFLPYMLLYQINNK